MFVLLWLHYIKTKENNRKKKQALLLAIGFSIPFVGGVISEAIFPLLLGIDSIPLTTPLITAFSITAVIAIWKYDLMDYSPHHQWNSIIEGMNEGVMIVNNEGEIMYANEKFCSIVGYNFHEMEGQIAKYLFLDHEESEKADKILEERKNNLSSQYEIRLKTKNGKKIWVLVSGSPYYDKKGRVVGSIGIHTDISSLKKKERELHEAVDEMDTFIYKASHDLKSPLSSLEGLINLAEKEITSPESTLYFGMINISIKKMNNMLANLTSIILTSKGEMICEIINFEQLIDETKAGLNFLPGSVNINFKVDITQTKDFHSDKRFLSTIFQNLLSNAIKFKRDNVSEPSYIHIYIKEDNLGVRIEISDNGIGIAENVQKKVFDMFYRGTEMSNGTGLGLYIVKATVKKLRGKIELRCSEGKQTTFIVLLPDIKKYQSNQTHDFKNDSIKCVCPDQQGRK